ncbi:hypothetical protein BN2475_250090 [Paraburkholderia ribeironis]|uniref:Uncharacterized protein n=1 Tax=Paraburkholderia ribeironis TaxID=1247936 RepID=A0A1N7RYQ8_9BURK|nr:hypothetical protein BN2475_250090 [Paraburkholderia ribeironis]
MAGPARNVRVFGTVRSSDWQLPGIIVYSRWLQRVALTEASRTYCVRIAYVLRTYCVPEPSAVPRGRP